jgi:hypothetical protein
MFLRQLGRECEFALLALEDMQSNLQSSVRNPEGSDARRRAVAGFWYSVDGFLMATGEISKAFWPPNPKDESMGEAAKLRGKELRRILGVTNNSPLYDRRLRDHFEHFDERLDIWFFSSPHHNIVDDNIMPRKALRGVDFVDILRNYDPTTSTLYFMGDELRLGPMVEALVRLKQRIDDVDLKG